jgi:hypothetical protein
MTDEDLTTMANTAFDVLNWARRMGMKRDEQIEQLVKAFRVDAEERQRAIRAAFGEAG